MGTLLDLHADLEVVKWKPWGSQMDERGRPNLGLKELTERIFGGKQKTLQKVRKSIFKEALKWKRIIYIYIYCLFIFR